MSTFKIIETILKVSLLPCHTEYPLHAVKEQINELLFRYHDDLEGVPIEYHDLKLPPTKEYGRIMNELPWLHIDICAKFLVFQPRNGDILTGHINKARLTVSDISHFVLSLSVSVSFHTFSLTLFTYSLLFLKQISDSHIALLVFGMFNATILDSELTSTYKYSDEKNSW